MLSFECDYNRGAHEKVLGHLIETNLEPLPGYGSDKYTEIAKEKIKAECKKEDVEVHFLNGGTQTNQIVIDSLLTKYEGVISADTGHINCHEAGAIEFTGHKVLSIPHKDGKLEADKVEEYLKTFYGDENHSHMVYPGMVYISHPTEYGTLYTKEELAALSRVCRAYDIPLFMDGARLGYGLTVKDTVLSLPALCELVDVFYIGGTKCGALCGEAVVFTHGNTPAHFITTVKQHGALTAKGRILGVQFDALFTDGLYFDICRHAIDMAEVLKGIFKEKGYEFFIDSPTNQIFIVLENEKMEELGKEVRFSFWEKKDENHTVVRFATSWATTLEEINELAALL